MRDNQFVAAQHVPVGAYRLEVTSPGDDGLLAGGNATVQVATLPASAKPVALAYEPDDQIAYTLVLPNYLTPHTNDSHWATEQSADGSWTATYTPEMENAAIHTHTSNEVLQLPVSVAPRPHTATVSATATLPPRFHSQHAEERTDIEAPGATLVDLGVYDAKLSHDVFQPEDQGTLQFRTHPRGNADEIIGWRAGDVITHTISFPPGLSVAELPAPQQRPGMTVKWSSPSPDTLIRTLHLTENMLVVPAEQISAPVRAGLDIEFESTLTIRAELPESA